MDDQPRGTKRWRFIRPDTREIGALVTEKAGQLGDPDILGRGLQLNERVVASHRNPCTFERLAHKEWARRRRQPTCLFFSSLMAWCFEYCCEPGLSWRHETN